ncbi:replication protein RepA [Rubrivirga litoralis]|uniref:Replication protein RepA n=1 Tax=Rubrivirga litoralis TaxID=3075598 RepID=A0ABU3BUI5_9BACT|nr:replication protein RepA [Rubrivirga sp. F394]MDT0632957.1 replication protein RepA [Rubrivirga sp. F394]
MPDSQRPGDRDAEAPRPAGGARLAPGARALRTTTRMVEAAYAIHQQDAWIAQDVRFMGSLFIQGTLPHLDPGDVREYTRVNGRHKLSIQAGLDLGLPYGSYPRLILIWLTTEVVQTGSREVYLGSSLAAFMRELGLSPTGGRSGTIGRFKDQAHRLFRSRIMTSYSNERETGYAGETEPGEYESMEVARKTKTWWDPGETLETSVVVGEGLFEQLTKHPVPIDMRVLREIKQSALALDLYTWVTYRLDRLARSATPGRPVVVSWKQLAGQFGTDAQEHYHFAADAKKALAKLKVIWPELSYETPRGRLVLHPGKPHVQRGPADKVAE